MKIEGADIIRIPAKHPLSRVLGNLREGAEISARIIHRFQGREALLDLGGKELRAEFLKGVPGSNHLTLVLDSVRDDTFFFRITGSNSSQGYLERLGEFLLSRTAGTLKPADIPALAKYLKGNPAGILELNLFLLNPRQDPKPRGTGITNLLSRLMAMGMGEIPVQTLATVILSLKLDPALLATLLRLLRQGKGSQDIPLFHDPDSSLVSMDSLLDAIGDMDDRNLREELLLHTAEFFQGRKEPVDLWELPLPCDGEIVPLRFTGDECSCIVATEFTALGKIEILAQKLTGGIRISIFADNLPALEQLRQAKVEITEILPGSEINFFSRQSVFDKLVEINSYYAVNSQFDIKI